MAEIDRKALEKRRAALSARLLEEARRLLDEIHQPCVVKGFSAGKVLSYRMPEPSAAEKRNLMVAAAVAIDKHIVLERYDTKDDKGYALVDRFIDVLMGPEPTPVE